MASSCDVLVYGFSQPEWPSALHKRLSIGRLLFLLLTHLSTSLAPQLMVLPPVFFFLTLHKTSHLTTSRIALVSTDRRRSASTY